MDEALARKLKSPKYRQRPTLPFSYDEVVRILAAANTLIEEAVTPAGKASAYRLRGLVLLLRYSGMRIGDAVRLRVDRITGNKRFLYTQKTDVPVYAVLPGFVARTLDATPRAAAAHFFWCGTGTLDGVVSSWRKRLAKPLRI